MDSTAPEPPRPRRAHAGGLRVLVLAWPVGLPVLSQARVEARGPSLGTARDVRTEVTQARCLPLPGPGVLLCRMFTHKCQIKTVTPNKFYFHWFLLELEVA